MMSRTVRFSCRYFKLMYIVAGILLSNEDICETVDQIQIAPRVEMKEKFPLQQAAKKVQRLEISENKTSPNQCWYHKLNVFRVVSSLKRRLRPQWSAFSLWTIPNYFIQCSSNLLCRTFVISSDCDVLYK
ncbi:uncharacterized protein LOC111676832 isoform X1 [Lucilia cuprina]|uniref:uncharacterized protein LOC111676832 isoform X1 n=1 Tax=Lucilia cuprina TaxID=7375 RepID=UPI001F066D29|nr:uncharacterized protein LOC111676832 isoform X1 [Lucilia cuprina]